MVWQYIVIVIVSVAVSYALTPKPPAPTDALPGEGSVPSPPRGEPMPVIFGKVWIKKPGVLYYGNKRTRAIKKGGGGKK